MSIPPWTTVPSVVWVADREGFDPRIPAGATVLQPHDVEGWLAVNDPCEAVQMLRARGATVTSAPDAAEPIRTLCRRLRARLAVCTFADLADVAEDLGVPHLAIALRHWTPEVATSFTNLSSAAARPHGRLDDAARILLALEHL